MGCRDDPLDTSALIAILFDEPEAAAFAEAMVAADVLELSAASFVETSIVVEARSRGAGASPLDALLRTLAAAIEPVAEEQARSARRAFVDFGKGRHPEGLDFGDRFAWALAKTLGQPLLSRGEDFAQTDVARAVGPAADG